MPNKGLRILIADRQHAQRRCVERILNYMGYYCVASVGSYDDLVALTTPPVQSFDLLIVDSMFAAYQGINISSFCLFNSHVYHSLIYGDCSVRLPEISRYQPVHASLTQSPDFQSIKSFMAIIDNPTLASLAQG